MEFSWYSLATGWNSSIISGHHVSGKRVIMLKFSSIIDNTPLEIALLTKIFWPKNCRWVHGCTTVYFNMRGGSFHDFFDHGMELRDNIKTPYLVRKIWSDRDFLPLSIEIRSKSSIPSKYGVQKLSRSSRGKEISWNLYRTHLKVHGCRCSENI